MSNNKDPFQQAELVDAVYEAVFAPAAWPDLMTLIARKLDADGTHCFVLGRERRSILFGASGRIDPAAHIEYREHYYAIDFRIPRVLAGPPNKVRRERELVTDEERRVSPFHNEYLAKYHCERVLLAKTDLDAQTLAVVAAGRSRHRGEFSVQSERALGLLLPHLRQSLRLRLRLQDIENQRVNLEAIVNLADFGVVLLDRHGRIVFANRAADTLLKEHSCVRSVGQRLVPAGSRVSLQAFKAMIESAMLGDRHTLDYTRHAMLLPRADGGPPVAAHAIPLLHTPYREVDHAACVVVFLVDSGRGRASRKDLLRGLFHLSPMEARLVELLCDGVSLEQAADRLNVSKNTVKTHLRGAFRKTNTRRQSELVAVLGRDLLALDSLLQRAPG